MKPIASCFRTKPHSLQPLLLGFSSDARLRDDYAEGGILPRPSCVFTVLDMAIFHDPDQLDELEMLRREYAIAMGQIDDPAEKLRLNRMVQEIILCIERILNDLRIQHSVGERKPNHRI